MSLAPILLFVYNRPEHVHKVLCALEKADLSKESTLIVYSDGSKTDAHKESVAAVRTLIKSKQWCREIRIIEREVNWGLADNIIDGVSKTVNAYGKVIVLESDIVISKGFLTYMNEALELYEKDERVMHISGYVYPYRVWKKSTNDTFFLKILSCWGWATWQRAWQHFNPDTDHHISKLDTAKKIKKFCIEGHSDAYLQLQQNRQGIINTWAVKWYASWLEAGGYALYPKTSLVQNIGNDGSGIHSNKTSVFNVSTTDYVRVFPIELKEDFGVRKSIDRFYKKIYHTLPLSFRIKKKVRQFFGNNFYERIKQSVNLFLVLVLEFSFTSMLLLFIILFESC